MDQLEETVKELQEQNKELFSQIKELRAKNESLVDANSELQIALSERTLTCSSCKKGRFDVGEMKETSNVWENQKQTCVEDGLPLERPAESSIFPQLKGSRPTSALCLTETASWTLWKIFTLYLLSQKCWQISKENRSLMTWKDWQQVCLEKLKKMTAEELWNLWQVR